MWNLNSRGMWPELLKWLLRECNDWIENAYRAKDRECQNETTSTRSETTDICGICVEGTMLFWPRLNFSQPSSRSVCRTLMGFFQDRDRWKQSPHQRMKSLLIFSGCFEIVLNGFLHFFEGHPLRFLLLLLRSESKPPSWGRHFPLAEDSHAGTGDSVWQKVTVLKQTSARSAMFWIAVLSRTCMLWVSLRRGRKQLRHLDFLFTSLTVIC